MTAEDKIIKTERLGSFLKYVAKTYHEAGEV